MASLVYRASSTTSLDTQRSPVKEINLPFFNLALKQIDKRKRKIANLLPKHSTMALSHVVSIILAQNLLIGLHSPHCLQVGGTPCFLRPMTFHQILTHSSETKQCSKAYHFNTSPPESTSSFFIFFSEPTSF